MSVKSKLLEEIKNKAQKIRERKNSIKVSVISVESIVFDFFKDAEEAGKAANNNGYNSTILYLAAQKMQDKMKQHVDGGCKTVVEFTNPEDKSRIRGVTVYWSAHYIKQYNCHPSTYIDIGQMLLF